MTVDHQASVTMFSGDDLERHISDFGALLHACVHHGASIGFILPFSERDAEAFWREKVLPAVYRGGRLLLVAEAGGRIAGSVQLDIDTPPNQPHRAEVSKLMVHPDCRRLGLARRLMAELERLAGEKNRSLITLDTRTGDSAEPLYGSMGYQTAGIIPCYCRDTVEDRLDSTTIMYKNL